MINIPPDFNWKVYLELNPDLLKLNIIKRKQIIEHYIQYGKKEERSYKYDLQLPEDFHWKIYLELNPDLLDSNINKRKHCIEHYFKYGKNEKRKYKYNLPEDFDWNAYLELNADLVDANINTKQKSINHYLIHGRKEEREYSYNNISKSLIQYYDSIHESKLLKTIKYLNTPTDLFLKYNVNLTIFDKIKKFIVIIDFENGGGGTTFFLNTIISKYKTYQTFVVIRCINNKLIININEEYKIENTFIVEEIIEFLEKNKTKIIKIFVNHTHNHEVALINNIFNIDKEVITITHDYIHLLQTPQPYFHKIELLRKDPSMCANIDINKYNTLITQNEINKITFEKYYHKHISVFQLPDYRINNSYVKTNNSNIVIAILGNITVIKGIKVLNKIINYYKPHKNLSFIIFGYTELKNIPYYCYNNIMELNELFETHKPNILLELSLWPETYSYTLSLSMLTKLPIIYLKKNFSSVIENRMIGYSNAYSFTNITELYDLFITNKQNFFYTISPYICYDKFWNDLFITNTERKISRKKNKYGIQPFFIYFPQFHTIKENDTNFYPGYNDIINLEKYNNKNINKFEEPDTSYFGIEAINQYNLTDVNIIQKQIDILTDYNISGLAMYYYWFSVNTVTNNNMVMQDVINNFFNSQIDMKDKKIFFIWANENWTDNPSFGNKNDNIIKNVYDNENFLKNSLNLIEYFKHENYLKIDNKPVFFIYHTYLISNIDEFYTTLNDLCIQHNFAGVHLVLNSIEKSYSNYLNFYTNFNYKKYQSTFYDENKNIKLNYKEYMHTDHHQQKNKIQTIVFDFNNSARLFEPNRIDLHTECINNTEFDKYTYSNTLIDTYENTSEGMEKILLINALNEWGEKMAFEPSNKYKFYNLNLLRECLDE